MNNSYYSKIFIYLKMKFQKLKKTTLENFDFLRNIFIYNTIV